MVEDMIKSLRLLYLRERERERETDRQTDGGKGGGVLRIDR